MNKLTALIEAAKAAAALDHNEAEAWYSAESMETYAFFPKNARFIAACDPQTILELCALLEKAEAALRLATVVIDGEYGCDDPLSVDCNETLDAIRLWKEQNEAYSMVDR